MVDQGRSMSVLPLSADAEADEEDRYVRFPCKKAAPPTLELGVTGVGLPNDTAAVSRPETGFERGCSRESNRPAVRHLRPD